MLTYGDGVSDVDLEALLEFHRSHGKLATITAVHPPSRFGEMVFDNAGDAVRFTEKPQMGEGWINGGFMVLEPEVLDLVPEGRAVSIERDVFPRGGRNGGAYQPPIVGLQLDGPKSLEVGECQHDAGRTCADE